MTVFKRRQPRVGLAELILLLLWSYLSQNNIPVVSCQEEAMASLRGMFSSENNGTKGRQRIRSSRRRLQQTGAKRPRTFNARDQVHSKLEQQTTLLSDRATTDTESTSDIPIGERIPQNVVNPYELGEVGYGRIAPQAGAEHLAHQEARNYHDNETSVLAIPEESSIDNAYDTPDETNYGSSSKSRSSSSKAKTGKSTKGIKSSSRSSKHKSGKKGKSRTAVKVLEGKPNKGEVKAKDAKAHLDPQIEMYPEMSYDMLDDYAEPTISPVPVPTNASIIIQQDSNASSSDTAWNDKTRVPQDVRPVPLVSDADQEGLDEKTRPWMDMSHSSWSSSSSSSTNSEGEPLAEAPTDSGFQSEYEIEYGEAQGQTDERNGSSQAQEKTPPPPQPKPEPKLKGQPRNPTTANKELKKDSHHTKGEPKEDKKFQYRAGQPDSKWAKKIAKKGKKVEGKEGGEAFSEGDPNLRTGGGGAVGGGVTESQTIVKAGKKYAVKKGARKHDPAQPLDGFPSWRESAGRAKTRTGGFGPNRYVYPPKKPKLNDEKLHKESKLKKSKDNAFAKDWKARQ